jgi:hypothetical protein
MHLIEVESENQMSQMTNVNEEKSPSLLKIDPFGE